MFIVDMSLWLDGTLRNTCQVDTKNEAVLLPIYGVLVPFHITTIRNVTTTNDAGGDAALVRGGRSKGIE